MDDDGDGGGSEGDDGGDNKDIHTCTIKSPDVWSRTTRQRQSSVETFITSAAKNKNKDTDQPYSDQDSECAIYATPDCP